tara:strand:+ start:1518 stop:3059 length:1542 start_codon:yes stop_codon:yes gene_type:complete
MASTFPMRTGNVSYQIGLSVPAITGSWSVSLGFLGLNENSWSISGMSGTLYNNSGYAISSYNSKIYTTIEGVISGAEHSIYQDGVLLTNVGEQEVNDYNMVSISGNYLEGYLPSVNIGGDSRQNDENVQTVPFWNKRNDDDLLFVTENATADLGFIRCASGMGFNVTTGVFTGNFDSSLVENRYGLIIFGAATTSGSYASGAWNSLGVPMMSLNSHLVCEENLRWYNQGNGDTQTYTSYGDTTGVVFPQLYSGPFASTQHMFWAEFPTKGWEKIIKNTDTSTSTVGKYRTYFPYGIASTQDKMVIEYSSPNTTVTLYQDDTFNAAQTYAGTNILSHLAYSDGALPYDLNVTFTDVAGATGVTTAISNVLGGVAPPANDLTGSQWGLGQIWNYNRVIPQTASYNVDTVYRRTTLGTGLYPTDQFNMYTGDISVSHGPGGDTFVSSMSTGKLITAWHKGFFTGTVFTGQFSQNELLMFSVTPTGMDWTGGYDMWNTLTATGKQMFVNSVMEFFIH